MRADEYVQYSLQKTFCKWFINMPTSYELARSFVVLTLF